MDPNVARTVADLAQRLRAGLTPEQREAIDRENRVRAVWGNLAIERPSLTIDQVRRTLYG